ncbi:MAG: MarC family protein [Planctomycetota bacterium]
MFAFALSVFAGFFAIMNPIVNTPIFISLTEGFDRAKRRRIAAKATITAFFVILVLALFGKLIFTLFGLTLPAFRITGGILVFVVGIELLRGEHSKTKTPVNEDNSGEEAHLGLAISPLSIPILAGPGTIVTAVNFIAEGSLVQDIITLSIFAFMCFWTYLMFVSGEKIVRYLGKNAVTMIGRIMGLILATLGVHMVTLGIYGSVIEGMHYIAEHL